MSEIEDQVSSIYHVAFILRQKLPPELVPAILDYAELWMKHTTACHNQITVTEHGFNSDRVRLGSGPTGQSSRTYLSSATIGTEGLSGIRPVRKVMFTITSHDQGWSSYPEV
jgi:hypothetical protein